MSDWSLKPRRHKEPEAQSRRQQQRFEARMDCIASTEVSCNLLCFFPAACGVYWCMNTHTHSCSELSLRILLWNASYMQKQSSYTWPERTRNGELETDPSLRLQKRKARLRQQCSENWKLMIGMPVLGLAGCHITGKNKIDRVILQAMSTTSMPRSAGTGEWSVHPSPIIASLRQVGMTGLTPLLWKSNSNKKHRNEKEVRRHVENLHLFRGSTHTCIHNMSFDVV